ncbi:MAG: PKD domain-containing protein [Tannerella sp.]|jgi:PKD repeat protein|nr:PKD domain-containing protein [Tannerella sp.]
MKKISNTKLYIIVVTAFVCITTALIIRFLLNKGEPAALVSPLEIYLGETIHYSDSSFLASEWLWEFGNGETSNRKFGSHIYTEAGSYRVRLTVDNDIQKSFMVNVRPPVKFESDSLIRILAPSVVMQEEFVVFKGVGYAREWRWSFGETRRTDSRDQVTIYAYERPGRYEIELMTEDTKYPVRHEITVLPKYQEDESDVRSGMGNDIREKLQAIVDGKPFNPNYNHILTKYLGSNPNIIITVNDTKTNDFYSYCQGLKIIDRRVTTIIEVFVFPDENNPPFLKTFKVMQSRIDD